MQQTDQQPERPIQSMPGKPRKGLGWGMLIAVSLIVGLAAFIAGTRSGNVFSFLNGQQSTSGQLDFSSVQDVYSTLREKYDGELDTGKLIEGAKKGLVDATGDPYTVYFSDEEADEFLSDLNGKFSGIGAELDKKDGNLIIVSTIDDSPARKSGLLPGDIIAKVNDQDAMSWSIDKAVSEIRGEKGTTVKLTIVRTQEVKEFSIVRAEIINPSVKHEVKDGVGILRISRFSDTDTVTLARQAAAEFKKQNVKGVMLDLRGNGGGYLEVAQDIVSLWLDGNKVIVQEKRGNEVKDTLRTQGEALLKGVPTVVLIDGGSASASEIVAGALHDHKAATLVGTKTFGKGSVQQIEKIGSGGQLKVTIAKWFTPNGKNISKEGIEPDSKVEVKAEEIVAGKDAQKDKALEILNSR